MQIAAASTALVLGAGRRINGQWKRGALGEVPNLTESKWKLAFAQCGLVLDVLGPDALREVRDGRSLNSVYEDAVRRRDEQRSEQERPAPSESVAGRSVAGCGGYCAPLIASPRPAARR